MDKQCYVEIVRDKDGEVMERMGPMPAHRADRVESGANINLNHKDFHTRIVEAGEVRS